MAGQRIRIRLKAFDHRVIDQSAHDIVETVKRIDSTRHCIYGSERQQKNSRKCRPDSRGAYFGGLFQRSVSRSPIVALCAREPRRFHGTDGGNL